MERKWKEARGNCFKTNVEKKKSLGKDIRDPNPNTVKGER